MLRRFREQKAAGRSSLIRAEGGEGFGGSGRPLPWRIAAASVSAIIALRGVCPFLFIVLGVSLFHVFFLCCSAASLRALLSFARVSQRDREMRR